MIPKKSLFQLHARSIVEVTNWSHNETLDTLDMCLIYNRVLPENVQHKRKIIFSKVEKCWKIIDTILGAQDFSITGTFVLHPLVKVVTCGLDEILLASRLNGADQKLLIRFIDRNDLEIEQTIGEISNCYGKVRNTNVLHYVIQSSSKSEEIRVLIQLV